MMTEQEAEEFIKNPGRIGVWKTQNINYDKTEPGYRIRKWTGTF